MATLPVTLSTFDIQRLEPLLARWGLNEGTGTTTGSSVGVFPGTLVNGPSWTAGFPIPDSTVRIDLALKPGFSLPAGDSP